MFVHISSAGGRRQKEVATQEHNNVFLELMLEVGKEARECRLGKK